MPHSDLHYSVHTFLPHQKYGSFATDYNEAIHKQLT